MPSLSSLFIALLALLPFQFALGAGAYADIAVVRVVVAAAILLWLSALAWRKALRLPSSPVFWIGWTFLGAILLSVLWAQESGWAARKAAFLLNFFPLYALGAWMFLEKKWRLEDLARGLAFAGGLSALFALFQFTLPFLIGLNPALDIWRMHVAPFFLGGAFSETVIAHSSWLVNLGGATVFRAVGAFPDPHIAAFFWELCLAWAAVLAIRKRSLFYGLLAGLIFLAILLTFSRGAYAALFIGSIIFIFFLLFQRKSLFSRQSVFALRSSLFAILISSLLLTAFCFLLLPSNPILDRALSSFSDTDGSNTGRLAMWRAAGETVLEKPWGAGLGNFPLEVLPSAEYRDPIYAHNLYLDIAAESGILAALLWIAWIGATAIIALQKSARHPLFLSAFFSLLLFSVHAIFDTPLYSVHILPVLLLILSSIFAFSGTREYKPPSIHNV